MPPQIFVQRGGAPIVLIDGAGTRRAKVGGRRQQQLLPNRSEMSCKALYRDVEHLQRALASQALLTFGYLDSSILSTVTNDFPAFSEPVNNVY